MFADHVFAHGHIGIAMRAQMQQKGVGIGTAATAEAAFDGLVGGVWFGRDGGDAGWLRRRRDAAMHGDLDEGLQFGVCEVKFEWVLVEREMCILFECTHSHPPGFLHWTP